MGKGESIPVNNPPNPIMTEAKAKDVRFLLETLHGQITRAAQDGFLPTNEAKRNGSKRSATCWSCCTSNSSTTLGSSPYSKISRGRHALPFERAVQYLRKQPVPAMYSAPLKDFEAQLARADSLVLTKLEPTYG
jgi:hypothetical protein